MLIAVAGVRRTGTHLAAQCTQPIWNYNNPPTQPFQLDKTDGMILSYQLLYEYCTPTVRSLFLFRFYLNWFSVGNFKVKLQPKNEHHIVQIMHTRRIFCVNSSLHCIPDRYTCMITHKKITIGMA